MTDSDYLNLAEAVLQAVEAACDHLNATLDVDIDNQRTGGMVTLVFANQTQIVVNLQKPLHEVWLAAKAGGFHYQFHSGQWIENKTHTEFFEQLSRCASQQAGQSLRFTPALAGPASQAG